MSVAKKNRRKITIGDRCFFWNVKNNLDWIAQGCPLVLSIISENKHFNVQYGINQDELHRHLTSLGQEFPKLNATQKCSADAGYQRVRSPR
jgi:hypothetical protein